MVSRMFTRMRLKLLAENRFTRYLLYATGEIVLVVIGILIALQINTWNEQRKGQRQEALILKNLHLEFLKNKQDLAQVKKDYRGMLQATKLLMYAMGREAAQSLQARATDSLICVSIGYYDYRPTQNVVADVISSGALSALTSDSLRGHLFQWTSAIDAKEEAWQTLDDFFQNLLMPYLVKHVSMKNVDRYGILPWEEPSRLASTDQVIFAQVEFENHLDNHAWGLTNYLRRLEEMEKVIDTIIAETEP